MTEHPDDLTGRIARALGGQYTIERELGRGGMGRVLLGRDVTLDRPVAIKVIAPDLAASAELRQRFLQEARTVARLRHPNIVAVYAAGETDGLLYFVMEFVPGESLRERIHHDGPLDAESTRAILHDLALALDTAHAAGIVHRDVKPENVLLDAESGRALLTDFGVARALQGGDGRLTGTGIVLGSPRYMSPEQAGGDAELDGRSDLYALGLVGYEMLSGTSPVDAPTAASMLVKHLTEEPRPLREVTPSVPEDLAAVVMRCLRKDRDARFATGRAMAAVLRGEPETDSSPRLIAPPVVGATGGGGATSGRTPRGVAAAPGGTTTLLQRTSRRWLAGAALLATAGVAAVFALLRGTTPAPSTTSWLVAPFELQTGNASVAWLREGAVNMLTLTLSQWQDLSVVDYERTLDLLRDAGLDDGARRVALDDARDVARRAGAGTLVMGQVTTTPDSLLVVARLYDVASGRRIDEAQRGGRLDGDPRTVFEQVARELLDLVGAPPLTMELTKQTTTNVEAYRAYLEGTRLLNRWQLLAADSAFARATALDSTFALAYYKRSQGLGWRNLGGGLYLRTAELAVEHMDRLPPRLQQLVQGNRDLAQGFTNIAANDVAAAGASWRSAQARFTELLAADSSDAEAWYALADADYHAALQGGVAAPDSIALALTRSIRGFNRAIALDSTFFLAYDHLVQLYQIAGNRANGFVLIGDSLAVLTSEAAVAALGGRDAALAYKDSAVARAREAAIGWLAQDPDGTRAYAAAANAMIGAGDPDSAVRILERGLARPSAASPSLGFQLASTRAITRDAGAVDAVRATLDRWPLDSMKGTGDEPLGFGFTVLSGIQAAGAAGRPSLVDSLVEAAVAIDSALLLPLTGIQPRLLARAFGDATKLAMGAEPVAPLVRSLREAAARFDALEGQQAQFRFVSQSLPYVTYLATREREDLERTRRWLAEIGRTAVPELDALEALARGDRAAADSIAATFSPPDSARSAVQTLGGLRLLARAEVLTELGDARGALATYEAIDPKRFASQAPEPAFALLARSHLARGRLYEQLGERDRAIAAYEAFAAQWASAEPPLDAPLREARSAITRLRERSPSRPVGTRPANGAGARPTGS